MATAAAEVRSKRVNRRRQKPKFVVVHGGRELSPEDGAALSLTVSDRFRAKQLLRRVERSTKSNVPERQSVAIAMLAVEERLVKAFWTIARQPAKNLGPTSSIDGDGDLRLGKCGLEYMNEPSDFAGYADAAGGKWHGVAPRPAVPTGREIDDANAVLDWLLHVDEGRRKILVVGATFKRGDAGRQINWGRVREGRPELVGYATRTLAGRYREALRIIVNELTLAQLAK